MKNVFIISGAAGSGKDSVIDALQTLLPLERIITSTTRKIRPGESQSRPYYFVSKEEFNNLIKKDKLAEYSVNENNEYYGVTKDEIVRATGSDRIAVWRVDWKGVITIKKIYPNIPALYIAAPIEILEHRLRARDQDKDEAYFQERMAYTREWLKHLDIYDYQVENEEGKLDETVAKVKAIIERHLAST